MIGRTGKSMLLMVALAMLPGWAQGAEIKLRPTESRILTLAERPGTIVISHPEFVSVQMVGGNKLLIQGLAAGFTNVLVLGRQGEKLANIDVNIVTRGDRRTLRVYQAGKRSSYICNPECAPAMTPNDDSEAVRERVKSINAYRNLSEAAGENSSAEEPQ